MTALNRFITELNNLMGAGISGALGEALAFNAKYKAQAAPAAKTTAVTLTALEILGGLLTATHTAGATAAYTLPTGALLEAADNVDAAVNEGFEWSLINLSAAAADTVTVTASSGHTIVGNAVVASSHSTTVASSSARFLTRKTAADTYVTYRIA